METFFLDEAIILVSKNILTKTVLKVSLCNINQPIYDVDGIEDLASSIHRLRKKKYLIIADISELSSEECLELNNYTQSLYAVGKDVSTFLVIGNSFKQLDKFSNNVTLTSFTQKPLNKHTLHQIVQRVFTPVYSINTSKIPISIAL